MTLAERISVFFLASLALILLGFSLALYLLAAYHLERQLANQVQSAVTALTAAVEIKEDLVEWEPHERRLELPGVRWQVCDSQGGRVGSSTLAFPSESMEIESGAWFVSVVTVSPLRLPREPITEPGKYATLVLSVAGSREPGQATLRLLGGALLILSLALWSLAALVGRRVCRRALSPVARMADSARSIRADEPGRRVEVVPTGDELEDLGHSFNALLGRLHDAFERQRRFTGEASHQLRTPLAVMLGQVEVVLRKHREGEDYRRVLGIVRQQAEHLAHIAEMLLFLARADAEAAQPKLTLLEVRPWLEEHLRSWASHPRAGDIRLVDGEPVQILAHASLLGQALDVLLDNACKYSSPGTTIQIGIIQEPGQVRVFVEDAGVGIDPEDRPRLFEPFFRSLQPRGPVVRGAGLGLAIAHRVILALGGSIEVTEAPVRGSRFTICMPDPHNSRI